MTLSDGDLARELDVARSTEVSAIRIDVDWSAIEREPGSRDWANTDRVVSAILDRSMCPLGLLSYTPLWATDPSQLATDSHFAPQKPDALGAFASAAASHYRDRIKIWEIWNEPNNVAFFKPVPNADAYGRLLTTSYRAIKSVDSSLVVISGGLSPARDDGRNISPPTFLSQLYAGGYNQYLDGVGMHPYTYPALPNDATTSSWSAALQMGPMRDTMVSAGDGGKRIWITECGAPTGQSGVSVSEEVQAQTIAICLNGARDTPWLGPAFVYAIRDSGTDLVDPEQNFGIVRRDFTAKAAYSTLRQFNTAG
jgi:polysaccharide biosynthesis protein PslG